jgi:uncharacterized cupredoxin-like copper-binding protein
MTALLAGALVLGLPALAACGDDDDGEDRPDVETVDGGGTGSGSGSGSGSGTGAGVEPGVVGEQPAGSTLVQVTLQEWAVNLGTAEVEAGEIYFLVENAGPVDPHEFVIIRTDVDPGALPVVDGRVPEGEVDLLDEIEPFAPGSSASLTIELEPGSYVVICNIAEVEEGELESHYELGMRAAFTVN